MKQEIESIDVMQLSPGDRASLSRTVTVNDIEDFGRITGDFNPAHFDEEYARDTVFGGRIAHGMLSAGFISAVIAMRLIGPGAIYREQSLRFLAPVKPGDTVTAVAEIVEIGEKRKSARVRTWCENQDGTVVVEGEALISLPRQKKKRQ